MATSAARNEQRIIGALNFTNCAQWVTSSCTCSVDVEGQCGYHAVLSNNMVKVADDVQVVQLFQHDAFALERVHL